MKDKEAREAIKRESEYRYEEYAYLRDRLRLLAEYFGLEFDYTEAKESELIVRKVKK